MTRPNSRSAGRVQGPFANPFVAGARGFIDDVVMPHEHRKRICRSLPALAMLRKHGNILQFDRNPWRKHGNMSALTATGEETTKCSRENPIDCKPRRNCLPRHQDRPQDGHQDRRCLFRSGQGRAARRPGRRSSLHRPGGVEESYLVMDKIIAACKQTGAEAVHPATASSGERRVLAPPRRGRHRSSARSTTR